MRIHSDILTDADIRQAARGAGVGIMALSVHGSRRRTRAFELVLTGSSKYGGQYGNLDHAAATWDEWGIVLNALFLIDEKAIVPRVYESEEHFHWATGDRYRDLVPSEQHARHNWPSGDAGGRSIGGSYYVRSCKCGAITRHLAHGRTFSDSIVSEYDGVV